MDRGFCGSSVLNYICRCSEAVRICCMKHQRSYIHCASHPSAIQYVHIMSLITGKAQIQTTNSSSRSSKSKSFIIAPFRLSFLDLSQIGLPEIILLLFCAFISTPFASRRRCFSSSARARARVATASSLAASLMAFRRCAAMIQCQSWVIYAFAGT